MVIFVQIREIMKSKVLFILLTSWLAIACSSDKNEGSSLVANASTKLAIEGMTCEVGCAGTIEKTLNKTAGIKSCEVDFENKLASVEFDNNQISEEEIKSIIENLNEGQYKVSLVNGASAEIGSSSNEDEISVSAPIIEIPNIFSALRTIL